MLFSFFLSSHQEEHFLWHCSKKAWFCFLVWIKFKEKKDILLPKKGLFGKKAAFNMQRLGGGCPAGFFSLDYSFADNN